ncbi:MAG: hypothetical protein NC911_01255 [Candidatus Omnitrophica bacterium]|nr:hypothetical protein [Candidatus Omnitrophota bacterium]
MRNKLLIVWRELGHHLPFSVLSVSLGLVLVGLLSYQAYLLGFADISVFTKLLFHLFHPVHLLFSAMATTAMFWQHQKSLVKAFLVGIVGSAGICGLSDVFIPYLAGFLLGAKMELHICLVQHPLLILPFLVVGVLVGFLAPGTLEKQEGVIFSHSLHVAVSSVASILYLTSFGVDNWIERSGAVLVYMLLAVLIPCCTSDVIFPLLLVKNKGNKEA